MSEALNVLRLTKHQFISNFIWNLWQLEEKKKLQKAKQLEKSAGLEY